VPPVDNSVVEVNKVSDDSDNDFFYDYNEGHRVFSVEVSGDFSDLLEDITPVKRGVIDPMTINTSEELYYTLTFLETLWSKPYVVVKVYPERGVFLNRGLEFRAWWIRKRFDIIMSKIPKSWVRVKGKKSRHVVVTVTVPHSVPIHEAYSMIRKRVREVIQFFRRNYGLKGYIGVLEAHEDGYPHYHLILFTNKRLLVFNHKGIWRFVDKRSWDKVLKVEEKGFIDCMSLRGGVRGVRGYFSKYLKKAYSENEQDSQNNDINLKPYVLHISRLYRIRPLIYSRNFSKLIPRTKPQKLSVIKQQLIELGKILSLRPKNLTEISIQQNEIRKRLDYISRNCSHEFVDFEDQLVLEFLSKNRLNEVFHYAKYLYSNSSQCVSLGWVLVSVS
jgi:hypothetical protein